MTGLLVSLSIILLSFAAALIIRIRSGMEGLKEEEAPGQRSLERLTEEIHDAVSSAIFDERALPGMTQEDLVKRERRRERLRRAVLESCLGDSKEREYVKAFIRDHISRKMCFTNEELEKTMPFDDEEKLTPRDKFELIYAYLSRTGPGGVFGEMVRRFELPTDSGVIGPEDIAKAYRMVMNEIDYSDRLEFLVQRCYEVMYGHDCTDLIINDSSVDGISAGVGGRTRVEYNYMRELFGTSPHAEEASKSNEVVYCVFKGRLIRLKFLSFSNPEDLERVVRNICRFNMRTPLSRRDPVLCGSLKDNSRVVAARPPVSDGWAFYVRKFASSTPADIRSLLVHPNNEAVIMFLRALIGAEFNFVISGNTGGGKTTLLKSLVSYIDPRYTLRVVETSFELDLNNLYPERNIHVLQERGGFTVYDAVTATKKMDTDVLIIGEVNEPKLAGAFIQVAQSGSRMALTTLHHETTDGLVAYLRNALVSECGMTDASCAERQVTDIISFDVHMVHDVNGNHYIERITEIIPETAIGGPSGENIRLVEGRHFACRNIIVFDRESMSYHMSGFLSRRSRERMNLRLGAAKTEELGRILCNMNYSSA